MAPGRDQRSCITFPPYRDGIIVTDGTHGLAWEELRISEDVPLMV